MAPLSLNYLRWAVPNGYIRFPAVIMKGFERINACLARKSIVAAVVVVANVAALPVTAQDTTTYQYDALGRLIQSTTVGGANDGLDYQYEYDAADNRKRVTVSGSNGTPFGSGKLIVLPINGFLVIPIQGSN